MEEDANREQKRLPKPQNKIVSANLEFTHYLSVRQCVEEMGYEITDSDSKNMLLWCDAGGSIDTASSLLAWQFYNHFPGIWSIARKVELSRNIERMNKRFPDFYNFHPKAFLLPSQFNDLKAYMYSIPKRTKRTMIIKPDRGSQGKGIVLIQDPDDVESLAEQAVAQQYISPFLIDGYKFDLRIYVLVTSVDPLRLYIHDEGMARFCTEPYVKPRGSNLNLTYSHLTNYSLNKKNEHFQKNVDVEHDDVGSKRSLSSVYETIAKMGHDVDELKQRIDTIIRLTLASVQPFLSNNYHTAVKYNDGKSRCFEILGFDIIIDHHLVPWLLEVNCMPSLACDSPFDRSLKFSVIKGALKIINLSPELKREIVAQQKAETQKRISGTTRITYRKFYREEIEFSLAKTTNWRLIYPMVDTCPDYDMMESSLLYSQECPVGAAVETIATRARKEAVLAQIRENELKIKKQKKQFPNRPPFNNDPLPPALQAVKTRTVKTVKRQFRQLPSFRSDSEIKGEIPEFFTDFLAQTINENEERNRIGAIRQQMLKAQAVNLLGNIRKLVPIETKDAKREETSSLRTKAQSEKKQRPRYPKAVLKPVVNFKQAPIVEAP